MKGLEPWDLERFVVSPPEPENRYDGWGAGAGGHVTALRYFTDPARVKIVAADSSGEYSGDCYAVLLVSEGDETRVVLWRDGYGSCSGCDGLDGADQGEARRIITDTLREGNTRQFSSYAEAQAYLEGTDDYLWQHCPKDIVRRAEEAPLRKVTTQNWNVWGGEDEDENET